jgi:hypothetical protein
MSNGSLPIVLRILDNENRLVERADQKSISLLSILGVFMVFFIVYYRIIPINILTVILVSLYFAFSLLSIICLVLAIRPRIRIESEAEQSALAHDPAFFMGICNFPSPSAYKAALKDLLENESEIENVYIRQIFSVARINKAKYKFVQRGIVLVIASLTMELAIIAYLFAFHMGAGMMPSVFS